MPPTTATTAPATDTDALVDALAAARERTLALVAPVSDDGPRARPLDR